MRPVRRIGADCSDWRNLAAPKSRRCEIESSLESVRPLASRCKPSLQCSSASECDGRKPVRRPIRLMVGNRNCHSLEWNDGTLAMSGELSIGFGWQQFAAGSPLRQRQLQFRSENQGRPPRRLSLGDLVGSLAERQRPDFRAGQSRPDPSRRPRAGLLGWPRNGHSGRSANGDHPLAGNRTFAGFHFASADEPAGYAATLRPAQSGRLRAIDVEAQEGSMIVDSLLRSRQSGEQRELAGRGSSWCKRISGASAAKRSATNLHPFR
jgi:hypothetical protein